jgi:hypothetical protein
MIDYIDETITIFDPELNRDVVERIVRWAVWFDTEEGTFSDLSQAKANCIQSGNSFRTIVPVPVAIGTTIFEIKIPR